MARRYPQEVHDFIRGNVTGRTTAELVDLTNAACGTSFTISTMRSYKKNRRLKSGMPKNVPKGQPTKLYPADVTAYIREHYRGTGHAEMARQLKEAFGRDYTVNQVKAYYQNHHLNSGLTGHFEKGHVPANKGRKGYAAPGSEKGWFQKGGQPWDTAPVGTILKKSDGYLWKKIADQPGNWRHNWKQLHLILWEEARGLVPDGCIVIFKDGNRENCTLENLTLITRKENAVMNKNGLRYNSAAHTETGILIAKVKIAAADQKKRRKL